MDIIAGAIKANPGIPVELTAENDAICSYCPHNIEPECQKVKDMAVLAFLGLKINSKNSAGGFFKMIDRKFSTIKDLEGICGNCSWQDKCLWYGYYKKKV